MAEDALLKTLYEEERKLKAELAHSLLHKRLKAVQAMIEAYQAETPAEQPKPPKVRVRLRPTSTDSVKSGTKTAQIMEAVVAFLREKGGRATSGEILKALEAKGITVGGKKPAATMASYLSNSRLVDNVKGEGYGLVPIENDKDPEADEAAGSLFK